MDFEPGLLHSTNYLFIEYQCTSEKDMLNKKNPFEAQIILNRAMYLTVY